MGLFSIFPESFTWVETWITRVFIGLGIFMIGPWLALLVYDLVLYLFRSAAYEIPYIGGRSRGKARPRAPSLTERPTGHRRRFSRIGRRPEGRPQSIGGLQEDAPELRFRNTQEEKDKDDGT